MKPRFQFLFFCVFGVPKGKLYKILFDLAVADGKCNTCGGRKSLLILRFNASVIENIISLFTAFSLYHSLVLSSRLIFCLLFSRQN